MLKGVRELQCRVRVIKKTIVAVIYQKFRWAAEGVSTYSSKRKYVDHFKRDSQGVDISTLGLQLNNFN